MTQETISESLYKIGAVSKITGIGIETLRMWERRYGAVIPARGKGTSRLYSEEDISRLTLLKQLVDRGNSISTIANLKHGELLERLERIEKYSKQRTEPADISPRPLKSIVCGRSLPITLRINQTQLHALDLSMTFEGLDQLLASDLHDEHDLLILEYPVVHQEDIQKIKQATRHARCKKVLLVYAYCNKKVLGNLELEGVEVLPAPVVPGLIDRRSQELFQMHTRGPGNNVIDLELDHDPTERRFDDATLAKVVNVATSINCECPHHLADIIYKLAAFEEYSASCESRNVQDRQLHSMLYNVTSRTRALFEDTLARVIEHEGIEINK